MARDEVVRALRRLPGLGNGGTGRRPRRLAHSPVRARHGPAGPGPRGADHHGGRPCGERAADRPGRTRPGAGRRPGPRGRRAAGGGARGGQVHTAAGGGRAGGPDRPRAGSRRPGGRGTGEASAAQVRLRADRIGAVGDNLYIAAETELSAVLAQVEAVRPELLIVDSVQTIVVPGVEGIPGGVTQIREVTSALMAVAKQQSLSTVLVGHVTRDGAMAGPRALEHLVDVVLHFEGDRHAQLRMVRALKNRFGPTDEVGCFELGESGLAGLADPSGLFISHHGGHVPGTCLTVTLEGRRPLIA